MAVRGPRSEHFNREEVIQFCQKLVSIQVNEHQERNTGFGKMNVIADVGQGPVSRI